MPTGKLTDRQKEIKRLMTANPEISVPEIAETLDASTGSIYQHIGRMRKSGHLPKVGRPRPRPVMPEPLVPPAATNGHAPAATLEELLSEELGQTTARLESIAAEREKLTDEEGTLTQRRARLDAAQQALVA